MAKPRAASTAQASAARPARALAPRRAALGPGLHPGRIELRGAAADPGERAQHGPAAQGSYRVRLASGRVVAAALGQGVSPALADECMRDGRTVILMDGPHGVVIAGALQVAPSFAPDERGTMTVDARHLRLRAGESIALEVPGASLQIDPNGAVRVEGDKLVIDMAAMVRIFSARVDIP